MSQELIRYRAVVKKPLDPGFLYAISFGENDFRNIRDGWCPMPYFRDELARSFFTGETLDTLDKLENYLRKLGVSEEEITIILRHITMPYAMNEP
jgi:hypothetical protein